MKKRYELPLDALQFAGNKRHDRIPRNSGKFQIVSDQSAVKRQKDVQ
jgi:hypothetical protein